MQWHVYILTCADGTLYTGISTDLERRITEHNTTDKGAKYTHARRPVTLAYSEMHVSRSEASKREALLKKLSRVEKLKLIGD
ncbi:GIY-YIG nuclease family protein [Patescibacteria group bacterium]|nr:GIY-YIG nuclease family protein [Patescibacteria group bacterium]MBU1500848.1 GIY-YIG nuclease family protein [Patescibacteria group bacterium]MBU2080903.1 GIY-YIG nuclease family protein [Patescibacteria group bacterium]MBU2124008.1 GIY-YIG nuclease family protein [Patescibacteria group bacterium]MBU2194701.1 GIY-YIG nuclease family protein [Patescibacteria group bacterium]